MGVSSRVYCVPKVDDSIEVPDMASRREKLNGTMNGVLGHDCALEG